MQSFTWGLDASGSLQGAGGVGGLISMTVHQGTNAGTYFYCFDGNHNVATLVNATNGAVEAVYELDAFLRILRATGRLAFLNPFVGSTKFYDWETGFYYYGYRYYDPNTGRWPNRDPLDERGGINLNCFVRNNPVSRIDVLGLNDAMYFAQERLWEGETVRNRPFEPNQDEESVGLFSWHYTRHTLKFKWAGCCNCEDLADKIYQDLKRFSRWTPNSIADANLITLPGGGAGVAFGTPGIAGIAMDFANQDFLSRDDVDTNPVFVALDYDDSKRLVTARTLGRHMLVGVRKWSVFYSEEGDKCSFFLRTWAVDKSRNFRNWAGAATPAGRDAQTEIWVQYLNNVVTPYRNSPCFIDGDRTAALDTHELLNFNPYLK